MRRADLSATVRNDHGKGVARKLRAAGRVPAVVYGEEQPPQALSIDAHSFNRMMVRVEGRNALVTLKVESADDVLTLIKDIQRDPLRGEPLHIDFLRVRADHKITTEVSINLEGKAIGVREGGILEFSLRQVEIECLPQDIPDGIPLDIREVQIGQSLHVSDLPKHDAFDILTDPERVVLSIISSAKLAAIESEDGVVEEVVEEEEPAKKED